MPALHAAVKKACYVVCIAAFCGLSSHAIGSENRATPDARADQRGNSTASANTIAITPLDDLKPAGQATMRFLGFTIYDAQLWVHPAFEASNYGLHPLALELSYHRDFTGRDIAKRSIDEMRGIDSFSDAQAQRWLTALQSALPDVKKGDKLLGHYQPGVGAVFLMRGKVVGQIADARFAQLFFGIWLSPKTSEPGLRTALLGTTQASAQ